MNNGVSELLGLCIKAKGVGIDAFLNYSPHVGVITFHTYVDGWDYERDADGNILKDEDGEEIVADWDIKFEFHTGNNKSCDEAILYLTNLIKEKTPQGLASE